jgi:hypothetical protein
MPTSRSRWWYVKEGVGLFVCLFGIVKRKLCEQTAKGLEVLFFVFLGRRGSFGRTRVTTTLQLYKMERRWKVHAREQERSECNRQCQSRRGVHKNANTQEQHDNSEREARVKVKGWWGCTWLMMEWYGKVQPQANNNQDN